MDFIATLPLEMAVNILSYLDSEDAVRCLAVSNMWREIVSAQDTYWKKACVRFGLLEYLVEEHKKCYTSPVALFLAARKQRLYISGSKGVFSPLVRQEGEYPCKVAVKKSETDKFWTPPCRTQSVGGEHFLETVYEEERLTGFFIPHAIVSLGILGRINGGCIEKVCEVAPDVCKSEWLQYLPRLQCIVTASSNPSADRSILWLKWSIPRTYTLRSHPSDQLSIPIPGGSSRSPLYSACRQCSLMVQIFEEELDDCATVVFIAIDCTGRLSHLHAEKVDLPHSGRIKYPCEATLAPYPSGCSTSTDTVCSSHHLVLRVQENIRIHRFDTFSAPHLRFQFSSVAHLSMCEIGRALRGGNKPMVSSDGKLLGVIQIRHGPATLHVWYLTPGFAKVC